MTNKEFAEKDQLFIKCYQAGSTPPTKRQASKYRNKRGAAYLAKPAALSKGGVS